MRAALMQTLAEELKGETSFTAARIARALGCTKQNVHQQLCGIRPTAEVVRNGQRASAWCVDALPQVMCRKLESIAGKKGDRTIESLLSRPAKRYEASVPFARCAFKDRARALQLRDALRPFIALRNDADAASAEFAQRGVDEYRRVVGHVVSPKHWRSLFERTIARDGGFEEWERPEIYLQVNPALLSTAAPISSAREHGLEVLEDALTLIVQRGELDVERKAYLWTKVCDQFQLSMEARSHPRKTKRAILKVLLRSGLLGASEDSIRRNFDNQWKRYCAAGGKSLIDHRTLRGKDQLPESDKLLIAAKTLDYDGRVAHGWRAARRSGELSAETEMRFAANSDRVPNVVRREVTPFARSLMPAHKGERAFRHSGPYIQGDYSKICAGEVHEMDDGTPEHVCYAPSADFPGYRILQGQIIVTVDRATGKALGFGYVEDAYHGRVIRSTATNACIDFGLCKRLNIERGLWQRAKLIVGSKTGMVSLDQWEMGLREFMRISHARGPQGKAIVERFFGSLWDRLRPLPGYCGPDMRKTCPETLQKQIRESRAGKVDPSSFCLSKAEFIDAIAAAMADYNATPQHGRLSGLSPNEAWELRQPVDGLTKVTGEITYLMAYHRAPYLVRRRQILRRVGSIDYVYHSEETARLDRRRVLLWTHPDDLSCVHITSLDRKEGPFTIPLIKCCTQQAEPDRDAIARAQKVVDHTNAEKRAEYRSIQPYLAKTRFRLTVADRATVSLGENIAAGAEITKRAQTEENRVLKHAQRIAREQGINAAVDRASAEAVSESGRLLREVFGDNSANHEAIEQ